jgi:hypothetical protein
MNTDSKRNFSRVNFAANAQIELKYSVIEAELLDISLKGALMRPNTQPPVEKGTDCALKIFLHSSDVVLTFKAELVHIQQTDLGFKFLDVDIDTMTHLRRLIDLNIGDQDKITRELSFLITD